MKKTFSKIAACLSALTLLATPSFSQEEPSAAPVPDIPILTTLEDGTVKINTTSLCSDVTGYEDTTPVEILVKDGKVIEVNALANKETPRFFEAAKTVLTKFVGKSVKQASTMKLDAVSGATYSSEALITNVQEGLSYFLENSPSSKGTNKSSTYILAGVCIAALLAGFFFSKRTSAKKKMKASA